MLYNLKVPPHFVRVLYVNNVSYEKDFLMIKMPQHGRCFVERSDGWLV
jgi:hypothetical protein